MSSRKATKQDFPFIYGLYMHPLVNPFLLYEQMSEEEFEPIFNDLLHNDILYVFEANNQPLGMFKLVPLKHRNSHIAYLGGVGIHPQYAGQGLGQAMLRHIVTVGREMNLLRIELSASTANNKAIRLYEKVGFEKEGILRKYTYLKSEGRFLDETMMAYLY